MVVGDSSLALHELLAERGARIVHVFDPDAARAMNQTPPETRGVVFRGMPDGDFDVRDGAFDLAIVPDLASVRDPAALLARLRRVVGADGAVICAAENRDAEKHDQASTTQTTLDYYELYDLVSLQFASVRMIAAMPFFGVTLAELGQDEVESAVRVDAELATTDRPPPSAFIALASQNDIALDAYTVIETGEAITNATETSTRAESASISELAEARLHAQALAAQVDELGQARTARVRAEEEARRALDALDVERERAARLERELDTEKRKPIPAPPPQTIDRTAEIAGELAEAQIRARALEEGVELAEKTIVVQRERIVELEAELERLEAIAAAPRPVSVAPEIPADLEQETARLEEKLRERGEKLLALEAELTRREKLVRELVARLPQSDSDLDPALAAKLDELALLAAHQRSELEARAWRIAELERSEKNAPS